MNRETSVEATRIGADHCRMHARTRPHGGGDSAKAQTTSLSFFSRASSSDHAHVLYLQIIAAAAAASASARRSRLGAEQHFLSDNFAQNVSTPTLWHRMD